MAQYPAHQIARCGEGDGAAKVAAEGDFDPATLESNQFTMEWPPRSGRHLSYPELDRVAWFDLEEAAARILPSQQPLIDALRQAVGEAL